MSGRSPGSDSKSKIDFIDPLFAVAIHIGIVEGLMYTQWRFDDGLMGWTSLNWENVRYVLLFAAGLWLLATSWVGYHNSIEHKPIVGDPRFILDIGLLLV